MFLEKDWPSIFHRSHIPRKTPLGLRKVGVSFEGCAWTFASKKGGRKEDRKSANGCSCRALSATRIQKGFFSLWTLCGLGSQLYWNTISVPADTDNDGFKPPRFHCRVFFTSGSKYHSTGSVQTKARFFAPARVQSPLGFDSTALH